jgi:hypothetical protein
MNSPDCQIRLVVVVQVNWVRQELRPAWETSPVNFLRENGCCRFAREQCEAVTAAPVLELNVSFPHSYPPISP